MDKGKISNQSEESALEPDLPICDAHHHLWDFPEDVYLARDLLADIDGHNVVETVFVEAWGKSLNSGGTMKEPTEQTMFAVSESKINSSRTNIAGGIVGYADLMTGKAVEPLIESHIEAGQGRFRGIRLAPGTILTDKKFIEGYSLLGKYGLVVDVFMHNQQLLELLPLAEKYPDTAIVVNHLGLMPKMHPNQNQIREASNHDIESWKEIITKICECKNFYMKLGGLGMDLISAGWEGSTSPDFVELSRIMKPWYFYCIEKFGVDRCMFESNFPVDKKSFSYNVHWNALKYLTEDFSQSDRNALFHNTAVKVYRIESTIS